MGYVTMTTTDAHRLSDPYVSTDDSYGEATSLPPGSKGVRGAIVAINLTNCITGKYKQKFWFLVLVFKIA